MHIQQISLISFRLKFRQENTLFENETLTPEDPKVLEVGLLPGKDLIWSLVQDLAEIETIGSMTSGVDGFRPKVVGTFELRHHCPCRIN